MLRTLSILNNSLAEPYKHTDVSFFYDTATAETYYEWKGIAYVLHFYSLSLTKVMAKLGITKTERNTRRARGSSNYQATFLSSSLVLHMISMRQFPGSPWPTVGLSPVYYDTAITIGNHVNAMRTETGGLNLSCFYHVGRLSKIPHNDTGLYHCCSCKRLYKYRLDEDNNPTLSLIKVD